MCYNKGVVMKYVLSVLVMVTAPSPEAETPRERKKD